MLKYSKRVHIKGECHHCHVNWYWPRGLLCLWHVTCPTCGMVIKCELLGKKYPYKPFPEEHIKMLLKADEKRQKMREDCKRGSM